MDVVEADWRYFKIRFTKIDRFLQNFEVDFKRSGISKYLRNEQEADVRILKEHTVKFEKVIEKYKGEFLTLGLDVPEMEIIYYCVADPHDVEMGRHLVK